MEMGQGLLCLQQGLPQLLFSTVLMINDAYNINYLIP